MKSNSFCESFVRFAFTVEWFASSQGVNNNQIKCCDACKPLKNTLNLHSKMPKYIYTENGEISATKARSDHLFICKFVCYFKSSIPRDNRRESKNYKSVNGFVIN